MAGSEPQRTAREGEGLAHLVMVLAALIFGVNYVIGRWATGEVPAYTLGFTRWTFAALVLLPFAWRHIANDRAWLAARPGLAAWYDNFCRRPSMRQTATP